MNFKQQLALCLTIIFCLIGIITYQLSIRLPKKTKPLILCSTTIIADTVKNIGKNAIDVISLMGPGIDPHLYKPVESDLIKIICADIIFYNGLHLEAKMADLFAHLAQKQTTIAVTKDIPVDQLISICDYEKIFDPHVWFDINLWSCAVRTISASLQEKFPDHAQIFQANTDTYLMQLQQLLADTKQIMATIPKKHRILITGHDAFSYFGRLYDCTVIGLQGISTESSPGAYDLSQIIQLIYDHNIPAIFIESSIPIKNVIALQQGVTSAGAIVAIGGQLYSDALDGPNRTGNTYISMLQHNVQTISCALQ